MMHETSDTGGCIGEEVLYTVLHTNKELNEYHKDKNRDQNQPLVPLQTSLLYLPH